MCQIVFPTLLKQARHSNSTCISYITVNIYIRWMILVCFEPIFLETELKILLVRMHEVIQYIRENKRLGIKKGDKLRN